MTPGTTLSSQMGNLLLVTGKVGYAYENYLAYFKGGYAAADVDFRSGITGGAVTTTSSSREHGWTAGIGIDYAISPRISVGVEYDYVRLNVSDRDQIPTLAGLPGSQVVNGGIDVQMVLARLNFKFGPRVDTGPMK